MASRWKVSTALPPAWLRPQFALLVKEAPLAPNGWHEIKYDGYRLHVRIDSGKVHSLTHSGLDWTHRYPAIAAALTSMKLGSVYIDGELCAVNPDGTISFSRMQAATDTVGAADLTDFAFDLLFIDDASIADQPLIERKMRLEKFLAGARPVIR